MTELTDDGIGLPDWVRRIFWSVVALEWASVPALLAVLLMPVWHTPTRLASLEMFCVGQDMTVYAAGYSNMAWDAVLIGDSQHSVLSVLGEPLDRWSHADDEWWWSYSRQSGSSDNYLERKLRFSLQGRVLEKHQACYVD